ncbi:hypothetical protein LINPERPRIM_LOCUS37579 [Linum perenne]
MVSRSVQITSFLLGMMSLRLTWGVYYGRRQLHLISTRGGSR